MKTIILFGANGSGKDTQAKKIVVEYQATWLNSSDIIKKHSNDVSDVHVMASGEPVSCKKVFGYFVAEFQSTNQPDVVTVVTGLPRTPAQATMITELLHGHFGDLTSLHEKLCIIEIQASFDVIKDRCAKRFAEQGRPDDYPDKVEKRLEFYKNNISTILNFFRGVGVEIHTIDGNRTPDEVFESIRQVAGLSTLE